MDNEGTKRLIELVLSDEKLKKYASSTYHDEPIIKTGNRMRAAISSRIAEMRRIQYDTGTYSPYYQPSEQRFYMQAKFMEDYEDDYVYGGYVRENCYSTYSELNDSQLRAYFTWRTQIRGKIFNEAPITFAYIYVFELLQLVGVKTAEDGYAALKEFSVEYAGYVPILDKRLRQWLNDFVVYYGLGRSLLTDELSKDFDGSLAVLLEASSHDDCELFEALKNVSTYNIERSQFYKQYTDDFSTVCCNVYRRLAAYYAEKMDKTLNEVLFGHKIVCEYTMFRLAVFYHAKKDVDYSYEVSPLNIYRCVKNHWTNERYYGTRSRNSKCGAIIKAIDAHLREKYSFSRKMKSDGETKLLAGIIDKEIELFLAEKKRRSMPVINIDVSKLGDIRVSAEKTRDKLMTDDEYDISGNTELFTADLPEIIAAETVVSAACEREASTAPQADKSPLDKGEYALLHALLYGGDYHAALGKGAMLSVLADGINEKLYDIIGDTVIEFDGDIPTLIDDYTDELKGIIGE